MFTYKHKKKFYHRHAALKYYLFYCRFAAIFIFYYQILQIQMIKKILIMKNKYFVLLIIIQEMVSESMQLQVPVYKREV